VKIGVQVLLASKNEGSSNLAKFFWNSPFLLWVQKPHTKGLGCVRELLVSRAIGVQSSLSPKGAGMPRKLVS